MVVRPYTPRIDRCVAQLMSLLLIASVALGSASCNEPEDLRLAPPEFTIPAWNEIELTPSTGSPQQQIDRFVEANDIDTTVTKNGLVYLIQDPGNDKRPTVDSLITVFYKGYLVDGRVFQQSTSPFQPLRNILSTRIKGWQEGLSLIGEGGRIWMIARPAVAYGDVGRPGVGITSSTVTVFEIQLLRVGLAPE